MTALSFAEVLKTTRQWPLDDQMRMVEALLRNLRLAWRRALPAAPAEELALLSDMSVGELRALAEAVVAPGNQQQIQALLEKNRRGDLSADEETTLDRLLDEADQVALLKARARYWIALGVHPPTQ